MKAQELATQLYEEFRGVLDPTGDAARQKNPFTTLVEAALAIKVDILISEANHKIVDVEAGEQFNKELIESVNADFQLEGARQSHQRIKSQVLLALY